MIAGHHAMLAPSGLPTGWRLLEYVESTGAQFVDTGIAPGANALDYEIVFSHDATTIKAGFGCRQTSSAYTTGTYVVFLRSNSGSEARIDIVNNGGARYIRATAGTTHTFRYVASERRLYTDDDYYTANTKTECDYNFILGGVNTAGTATAGAPIKIYSASFRQSGVLVRDYLPVKDSSGVAGLWDAVTRTAFYSATSTSLVAGPEL